MPGISASKLKSLGENLQNIMTEYNDVLVEYEAFREEFEGVKQELTINKEKCENFTCSSSLNLKQEISSKSYTINLAVTELKDTKQLSNPAVQKIVHRILNILTEGENLLTPPNDQSPFKVKTEAISPVHDKSIPDIDQSVCLSPNRSTSEIESTPTGRISPVILSRKSKTNKNNNCDSSKKKSSNSWPCSDAKMVKLLIPTTPNRAGKGRMRQTRFQLLKTKPKYTVDLTSPQFNGESQEVKIKQEIPDIDDTILPSPTSRCEPNVTTIKYKVNTKSPNKMALSKHNIKTENQSNRTPKKQTNCNDDDAKDIENSINIMNRFRNSPAKFQNDLEEKSIKKVVIPNENFKIENQFEDSINLLNPFSNKLDKDETYVNHMQDTNASLSILQRVNKMDTGDRNMNTKSPLKENINIQNHLDETNVNMTLVEDVKKRPEVARRLTPEKVEPIFKEPTVRKKAEKRALPGWSCYECENFYAERYKDDPDMLLQKMNECSKHRGKNNPQRPKTPPNFWHPRWDVPEDTEAFNARNNV